MYVTSLTVFMSVMQVSTFLRAVEVAVVLMRHPSRRCVT